MLKLQNIHDAVISGLHYSEKLTRLKFSLTLAGDQFVDLVIDGVFGWDLSAFEIQNVIFDVCVYSSGEVDGQLAEELGVHEGYIQWLNEEDGILVDIDSSTGISGYIIGKSWRLECSG